MRDRPTWATGPAPEPEDDGYALADDDVPPGHAAQDGLDSSPEPAPLPFRGGFGKSPPRRSPKRVEGATKAPPAPPAGVEDAQLDVAAMTPSPAPAAVSSTRDRLEEAGLVWASVALALAFASPWLGLVPGLFLAPLSLGVAIAGAAGVALGLRQLWADVPPAIQAVSVVVVLGLAWWFGSIHLAVVAATALLLAANLAGAVRVLARTGRTRAALPTALVATLLFAVLFVQISAHLGADHFTWSTPPGPFRWLGFVLFHVFRALDVPDALQAAGLPSFQPIHHAGALTAALLMLFHLSLDLFALDALSRILRIDEDIRDTLVRWAVLFLAVVLPIHILFHPWYLTDLFLWPLDNLVRVVDFADVMQLFNLRLHGVAETSTVQLLGLSLRVLLAFLLLDALSRAARSFKLRRLGGLGLDEAELKEAMDDEDDPELGELAARRLERIRSTAATPEPPGVRSWYGPAGPLLLGALGASFVFSVLAFGAWPAAVQRLAAAAVAPSGWRNVSAAQALVRMGRFAAGAIPVLDAGLANVPETQRLRLIRTLGALGPGAVPVLEKAITAGDETTANAAIDALERIGPEAAPALLQARHSSSAAVRAAANATLMGLGPDAAQALIDAFPPEDRRLFAGKMQLRRVEFLSFIAQLDPDWDARSTANPEFRKVLGQWPTYRPQIEQAIQYFAGRDSSAYPQSTGVYEYAALRPDLLPALSRASKNEVHTIQFMSWFGPAALPYLREKAGGADMSARSAALEALAQLGDRDSEAQLLAALGDGSRRARVIANKALAASTKPSLGRARRLLDTYSPDDTSPLEEKVRLICEPGAAVDELLLQTIRSDSAGRTLALAGLLRRVTQTTDADLRRKALSAAMELARSPRTSPLDLHWVLRLLPLLAEPGNPVVNDAMAALLIHPDESLSNHVRSTLSEIGVVVLPAVAEQVVRDARFAPPARQLLATLDGLGRFRPEDLPAALPGLRALVEAGDDPLATAVIGLIERMGPKALPALGDLTRWATTGRSPAIVKAAGFAIGRVAPHSPLATFR